MRTAPVFCLSVKKEPGKTADIDFLTSSTIKPRNRLMNSTSHRIRDILDVGLINQPFEKPNHVFGQTILISHIQLKNVGNM